MKEPRRTQRKRKKPARFNDFVVSVFIASTSASSMLGYEVPLTWDETMASPQKEQWPQDTKEEFLAQLENETWIVVPRPKNAHILKHKWIWVLKENEHRLIRFMARLVVLRCLQIWKLDYDETLAPVIRFETLQFVLLYAGMHKMVTKQFDFVMAFLNASTDCVIYTEQPVGHVKRGYEDFVCLLFMGCDKRL
ncbi:unnamed protein product [Phytophthora fragariaefolia]|uniref:Unnamed protein product n=1 Tax=Phytophthora fragariaefolia TaxID=1490495 RepID=A0A9W6UB62_9STRA|nr:unnamed protein product [Phytophthora fragariaefolia]